jgi:hypothetical protein
MKKNLRCDKCGKYLFLIPALLNQFTGFTRAVGGGWWGGRGDLQPKNLLDAQNTEKSVSAIRAADILFPLHLKRLQTSKTTNHTTNLKTLSVINATKHNITSYVGEALT